MPSTRSAASITWYRICMVGMPSAAGLGADGRTPAAVLGRSAGACSPSRRPTTERLRRAQAYRSHAAQCAQFDAASRPRGAADSQTLRISGVSQAELAHGLLAARGCAALDQSEQDARRIARAAVSDPARLVRLADAAGATACRPSSAPALGASPPRGRRAELRTVPLYNAWKVSPVVAPRQRLEERAQRERQRVRIDEFRRRTRRLGLSVLEPERIGGRQSSARAGGTKHTDPLPARPYPLP